MLLVTQHIRCPNAKIPSRADRSIPYVREWTSIYLQDATRRIQKEINGLDIDTVDVYTMQQLCAYEVCIHRTCGHIGRALMPIYRICDRQWRWVIASSVSSSRRMNGRALNIRAFKLNITVLSRFRFNITIHNTQDGLVLLVHILYMYHGVA